MNRLKTYVIPGEPVPLARARFTTRRVYDSQKQLKLVWGIELANQHDNNPLFVGPLYLEATFYFPLPSSASKKRKKEMLQAAYHRYKPDLSNLLKWIEDCATGVIYQDDCIIASILTKKLYSDNPRTEFTIMELNKGINEESF